VEGDRGRLGGIIVVLVEVMVVEEREDIERGGMRTEVGKEEIVEEREC
jgi:hypothetical protein